MPIKGWTEGNKIPRMGTIALGMKDEKGHPVAVDYFVVPEEVQAVYKNPKPKELDIVIPHEDLEVVMPAYLKRYGDQFGLICRGDGETATLADNYFNKEEHGVKTTPDGYVYGPTGEKLAVEEINGKKWVRIPCLYKECPLYAAKKCREVAILSVMLPKVPGVLGVYSIDTGSYNSYQNIKNSLEMLRAMVGRISFIPLKLKVKMEEKHPVVEKNGKVMQIKRPVPILYIDMGELTLERMIQLSRENRLLITARMLPGPQFAIEPPDEERKPELLFGPFAEDETLPEAPPVQDTVIVPDEDAPGPVVISDDDEAQPPVSASGDDEAAFLPADEENPFIGAGDAGNAGDEIPWWEVPPDQMENAFGDFPGEAGPVPEPAEPPKEQKQKEQKKEQKKEEKKAEGEWKVRLTEKPPVKPVKVNGSPSWVLAVERNTKQGMVKGTLLVPAALVKEEFVKSLVPKKDIIAVTGTIAGGESGFVITAQNVRLEKAAA